MAHSQRNDVVQCWNATERTSTTHFQKQFAGRGNNFSLGAAVGNCGFPHAHPRRANHPQMRRLETGQTYTCQFYRQRNNTVCLFRPCSECNKSTLPAFHRTLGWTYVTGSCEWVGCPQQCPVDVHMICAHTKLVHQRLQRILSSLNDRRCKASPPAVAATQIYLRTHKIFQRFFCVAFHFTSQLQDETFWVR